MSCFVDDIRRALDEDRLPKRFRGSDLKEACPGWAERTYSVFLPKHRVYNPGKYKKYFKQHTDGSYSLIE